MCYTAIIVILC